MARRLQPAGDPADAKLDDLLGEVEAPTPPTSRVGRWALRGVVQTFVVTLIAYTLVRAIGLAPPFLLILSIAGGAVLVRLAAVSVKPPRGHRPTRLVATRAAEPPARADGVLAAVRHWDRRLAGTGRGPTEQGLSVALGELADERLRQRHGLTRASDPARARALLGEPVWALLGTGTVRERVGERSGSARDRTRHSTVTAAQAEMAIRRLESM
jgi:hypothetical protein